MTTSESPGGKIVWSNDQYMRVLGEGFGTRNQFNEWFGPKIPINECSEANGMNWARTDGELRIPGLWDEAGEKSA